MDDEEHDPEYRAHLKRQKEYWEYCQRIRAADGTISEDEARSWMGPGPNWTASDAVCLLVHRRPPRLGCSSAEEHDFTTMIYTGGHPIVACEETNWRTPRYPAETWLAWWRRSNREVPMNLENESSFQAGNKVSHDKALRYLSALIKMLDSERGLTSDNLANGMRDWRKKVFQAEAGERVGYSKSDFEKVASVANKVFNKHHPELSK